MWFLSKGKMEVQLEKYQFVPGETIKGKVTMTLKKPIDAEGVKIAIYAYKKEDKIVNGRPTTTDRRVYEFEQYLDRKHGYAANQPLTYSFQIAVPSQSAMPELPGALGTVVKAIGFLARQHPVRWYLEASLDIKMAFDLRKKVEIQVVAGPGGS